MNGKITITPNRVLHGEKVDISLKGFLPKQKLKIKATLQNQKKCIWSSKATFICDEKGELSLNKVAPISGSYSGIEPMGLLVYMEEENSQRKVAYWERGLHIMVVNFSVTIDKIEVAKATLERYHLESNITQEKVKDNGLEGKLFLPHNQPNQNVLICLSGSDGGLAEEMGAVFASHGFATFSLAYFAYESLPKSLSEISLEYFEKAFKFLDEHPYTNGKNISIVGGSRGAELALLLASRYSQISSVVAYAPSHVLWSGLGNYKEMNASAWSYQNKELPFVQVKMPLGAMFKYFFSKKPIEFTSSFLHSLKKSFTEEAVIPVENIKGDILLISGEDDQMWCSTLMAKKMMNRLKKHDFSYKYEHLNYKNAGHFITIPYYPSTHKQIAHPHDKKVYALGGDTLGDLRASEDSWLRVLEFLKRR